MNFLYQLPFLAETLLGFYLLVLLLQGPCRKYVVFSTYIFTQIVTHTLVTATYFSSGFKSAAYRNMFWTDEVALDLLLFLVVISFTYQALNENPLRPKAAKILAVIVVVGLALPFTMINSFRSKSHGVFSSQWFNHASQIFNFAAAIMNLVLWTALLTNRKRDMQLVNLSVGVGLVTASASIAWGVRQFFPVEDRWPLDILMPASQICALLLWCRAFRQKPSRRSSPPPSGALITPSQP